MHYCAPWGRYLPSTCRINGQGLDVPPQITNLDQLRVGSWKRVADIAGHPGRIRRGGKGLVHDQLIIAIAGLMIPAGVELFQVDETVDRLGLALGPAQCRQQHGRQQGLPHGL